MESTSLWTSWYVYIKSLNLKITWATCSQNHPNSYKDNSEINTPSESLSSGVRERALAQELGQVGVSLHSCQQVLDIDQVTNSLGYGFLISKIKDLQDLYPF